MDIAHVVHTDAESIAFFVLLYHIVVLGCSLGALLFI
jgi:hypothetical protein